MSLHNSSILAFGFALALLGAPILLLVTKFAAGNSLGLPFRLSLWALAGVAIGIARLGRALPPGAPFRPAIDPGIRSPVVRTRMDNNGSHSR
jgi:hypothetical protein